jgi:HSP20 family molecular chaperone IbpA
LCPTSETVLNLIFVDSLLLQKLEGGRAGPMAQELVKVAPDVCSYVNDDHTRLFIEITIPGVEKKDINLKMHEDSFNLTAPRKDIEYVTTLSFCCPVVPEKAEAKYENGLLKIEIPFKDEMDGSLKINIK